MSAPLEAVYAGPFAWHAGLEIGLLGVRRAIDQGAALRVRLVGDGPERERIVYTIADLGLEAAVSLAAHGRPPAQRGSELFFWPALRFEGGPVLDAARRGDPLIGSDLPELRAALAPGSQAELVPPRSPAALAEALLRRWRAQGARPTDPRE